MMKRAGLPTPIELAVLAYCAWQASDLPTSWWSAPAVRWAWIAFIIWCIPAVVSISSHYISDQNRKLSPYYLGGAIALSLLGTLGSLHALQHLGFAVAIAAFVPPSLPAVVWLGCCIGWMPGFGWFAKLLPFTVILLLQLGLAAGGSAVVTRHAQARRQ